MGAAIVIVLGFMLYSVFAEGKRKQAIEKTAAEMGLEFSDGLKPDDQAKFEKFQLAQRGRGRKAQSAILADSGELRMTIFDYSFTTGSGRSRQVHRQTVCLCTAEALSLPSFSLSPEDFFSRFRELFGGQDIDFADDSKFSDSFILQGTDEEQVRAFFTPARRKEFSAKSSICLEAEGDVFIFYQRRRRTQPEEIRELMGEALHLYKTLRPA